MPVGTGAKARAERSEARLLSLCRGDLRVRAQYARTAQGLRRGSPPIGPSVRRGWVAGWARDGTKRKATARLPARTLARAFPRGAESLSAVRCKGNRPVVIGRSAL